jgi:uracil-DNA glycosylase family 4
MKQPQKDCSFCPRLTEFREKNRKLFPDKFNSPVPSFGPLEAQLLVVGLAPGLRGANFTGRPFTGDYAGDLLYKSLLEFGFAEGVYKASPDDGLSLKNCRVTNAVRCLPPENKPVGSEIKRCQEFLVSEMDNLPNLRLVLALGKIAHDAVVRSCGEKLSTYKFSHNGLHQMPSGLTLVDSYHCSRYNTNTGRLTEDMFYDVFRNITAILGDT